MYIGAYIVNIDIEFSSADELNFNHYVQSAIENELNYHNNKCTNNKQCHTGYKITCCILLTAGRKCG